ncbi:MAG TPA: AzlD domain-containing protein [Rubrobacter sp.]|nr:AzlD domain-containing protein [Rubrobacter sp.]
MAIDPGTLLAIVLMALATYATRAGGLWLASRFDLSERAGAWLDQIPGAILVSLVAPTVLMGGPVEVFAAIVVVIVSLRTGSLPAAMVTGVGTVLALQALQANLL